MSTTHHFGTLVLCAVVGLSASLGAPRMAAAQVTVSFGELSFSWPEDARALNSRLQQLAHGACFALNVVRLVEYATCRHCLRAALEEAVHDVSAGRPGGEPHRDDSTGAKVSPSSA